MRAPLSSSVRFAALVLPLVSQACWLDHGAAPEADPAPRVESTPDAGPRPPEPIAREPLGALDAGVADAPDAEVRDRMSLEDPCQVGSPCDGSVTCDPNPIDGVPCCLEDRTCIEGTVVSLVACDDSCGQSCTLVRDGADCAAFGCAWFVGGCADEREPGVYYGPGCIPPPGDLCLADDGCAADEVCQTYWINPCLDQDCDACGGAERRCTQAFDVRELPAAGG